MTLKVVFCAIAVMVNLQVVRNDDSASPSTKTEDVKARIERLFDKAHGEIDQQIQDILARILFIRDTEISSDKHKLAKSLNKEVATIDRLLKQTISEKPDNECLNSFDKDYAKAIRNAGNSFLKTCISNYPPGGSVIMDISEVKENIKELQKNISSALQECNQMNGPEAESCVTSLDKTFEQELAQLKESKITHMKAEATEAEILERVQMDTCMKEALTNARVKRDTFKDLIHECVAEPRKIDSKVNLAFPRQ